MQQILILKARELKVGVFFHYKKRTDKISPFLLKTYIIIPPGIPGTVAGGTAHTPVAPGVTPGP